MVEYIRLNLAEKMLEEGLVTKEQLDKALEQHSRTGETVRKILLDMNFIDEERLMDFLGNCFAIPFFKELTPAVMDIETVKLVPEKIAREYHIIPLFKTQGIVTLAMDDPLDVFMIDDIETRLKIKVEAVFCKREQISKSIDRYYGSENPFDEIVEVIEKEKEDIEIINNEEISPEETMVEDEAPIIKLVNTVITQGIKEKASDIHIEPDEKKLRIRYRIDGVLRETMVPPKRLQLSIISRIKIMAGMDIAEKRGPQDGRIKVKSENKDIDIRVSSLPTIYGEKIVMRLLDQSSILMGIEKLGFSADKLQSFQPLINRPYGIILVTGPTGSGKTTTLYVAMQSINSIDKNIITIEDPVEYNLPGINQIPVNVKAGVTFSKGLRSILRQDPDVIMVGEMRDIETAEIAVRAALTGHLVFSTLHTNDAASTVIRLVDMGIPAYLVASSVTAVLAQRLVRTICQRCKKAYKPDESVLRDLGLFEESKSKNIEFYKGEGCRECAGQGYKGRIGIFELMFIDEKIRELIHSSAQADQIKKAAQQAGMQTLMQDGLEKVIQGITTVEELKRITIEEE